MQFSRYATEAMQSIFSPQYKYLVWRKLWISLAKAQKELGLDFITDEMLVEMETNLNHIDFERVKFFEKKTRHEVIAHLKAFSELCPKAKKILHLGATSAFVMDNGDLIQIKDALIAIKCKLIAILSILSDFALKYASLPCLAYTHYQPAQPTTMGKRACLWLQDLLWDFHSLDTFQSTLPFLGAKGATGTQASFLLLFSQDHEKVKSLDIKIASDFGFTEVLTIASQTYPRKIDLHLLSILSSMGSSIHKLATDIRLLMHDKELEEFFEEEQVGSSAMPYKRNPIRSERLCSLSRYLMSLWENGAYTASLQWLERSLDDSAGRRLYLSEACLAADSLLNLLGNVLSNLKVNQSHIEKHLNKALPFLAAEPILMKAVLNGKDRGKIHEILRKCTMENGQDFLKRLEKESEIGLKKGEIESLTNIKQLIGRAPEQVEEFIKEEINPLLNQYPSYLYSLTPIEI